MTNFIKKTIVLMIGLLFIFSSKFCFAENTVMFFSKISDISCELSKIEAAKFKYVVDASKIHSWYEFLDTMYKTFEIPYPGRTYDGFLDELRGRACDNYYSDVSLTILNYNQLAFKNRDIAIFLYECFEHVILPYWDGKYDGSANPPTEIDWSKYGLPKKFNVYIEGDKLEEEHIYF